MAQPYGHQANMVKSAHGFACLVCGANPTRWTWTDLHGEAMCTQCGTPYQLLRRDDNDKLLSLPPKINIKEAWLPTLKQYWEETSRFIGLGAIMIARDYPECIGGQEWFNKWLDEHPELIPEEPEGEKQIGLP